MESPDPSTNRLPDQRLENLGILTRAIAHDFNNLLAIISGHVELARSLIPKDSPAFHHILHIEKASARSTELCSQILHYVSQCNEKMGVLNIAPMLMEISELLRVSIPKNIQFKLDMENTPCCMTGNTTQLHQILMNLILNAADAIGQEPGEISVSSGIEFLTETSLAHFILNAGIPSGKNLFLRVRDSGPGLDVQFLRGNLQSTMTTKGMGHGVGLTTVLDLIRRHQGGLDVQSSPGQGTTFTLYFKMQDSQPIPASPDPVETHWRGSGRVMVVDDDESVRLMTSQLVESLGFEVTQASSTRDALQLSGTLGSELKLILMDMTLSDCNAEKICHELTAISPGSRILLMSGYPEIQASNFITDIPVHGFIQKPFKKSQLQEKIRQTLESASH